jgi:N-acetylglucosamine-6-phosphate deacetylase
MQTPPEVERHSFRGCTAVPGFIDIHLHGAGGIDFTEAAPGHVAEALSIHLEKGTTSCLPTLMTTSGPKALQAISSILEARDSGRIIPEIVGINMEGPFISPEKRGVQDKSHIRLLKPPEMESLMKAARGAIRIVTIAPEREGAMELIRFLAERGVVASAGHTNADYEQTVAAIDGGVRLATHMFNAMRGILQREPGAAGALLVHGDVFVELIADGEHIHPALFTIVARTKGTGRIILVTDATTDFGHGTAASRTEKGVLMGSNMPLPGALRLFMKHTGLTLQEALRTVTLNPARLLGLDRRIGCLRRGADADMVILDRKLDVKAVFLKGNRVK